MATLTSKERMQRILKRQPVDRVGLHETFWPETISKWKQEGHLKREEDVEDHFNTDIRQSWAFDVMADLDFGEKIVEETEETKLVRNGNGALLRWHKQHSATPEHVDFMVKDREKWESAIRPHLLNRDNYRRRIKFGEYRQKRSKSAGDNRFFVWSGINVFESMHPVCGHENMLVGMALDPDWVKDMCRVYSEMTIDLMEILFAEEGKPDGIWFYEDMGFKFKPFMSPAMYKEIVWPAHKRTFDFAHSLGLPVIIHSCGFVEPLVPGLIEAGMDCQQAMEVKAGMDVVRLKKLYGDKLSFIGGMDVRVMASNDPARVLEELEARLPEVMKGGGYCLCSDHSVPDTVDYKTYRYFAEKGLELGTYK